MPSTERLTDLLNIAKVVRDMRWLPGVLCLFSSLAKEVSDLMTP